MEWTIQALVWDPRIFVVVYSLAVISLTASVCFCISGVIGRCHKLHMVGLAASGISGAPVFIFLIAMGSNLVPELLSRTAVHDVAFIEDVGVWYLGAAFAYVILFVILTVMNVLLARKTRSMAADTL
ncbi:hypothetical protein KPC83_05595 [Collinsella sp. zg1085]|uniref:hypothetical protein n=1 Tax=Collinsella sp. zg1085 TaxID=2844380 RepID=UPI001C0E83EE|nr:hypothetical protein [Collinsella sp. zg1085]QWT17316.1 hypothetical protein KPC83_05595 [Collinsella sp. zg1085]